MMTAKAIVRATNATEYAIENAIGNVIEATEDAIWYFTYNAIIRATRESTKDAIEIATWDATEDANLIKVTQE